VKIGNVICVVTA